ncbi:MAG TPA: hypothetical protein VNW30_08520 [Opitutaceae bacterium]|nr:hypothetical protein [Opitutaceae bacterium]
MHFRFIAALFLFFTSVCAFGANVAPDGFPTGQDTPEGVATDLARVFISHDAALFDKICVPPYGGKDVRDSYGIYCYALKKSLGDEAKRKVPSPDAPKSVGKVFAARRLTANGPVSYGSTVLGFEDVQFVDVGVYLVSGDRSLNRTLVVKINGKWFVHPEPSISPLLCKGLNEEDDSVTDWTEKEKVSPPAKTTPPVPAPPASKP